MPRHLLEGEHSPSPTPPSPAELQVLAHSLEGDLHWDRTVQMLYATDASAYREFPLAVAYPRTESDLMRLVAFAREHRIGLIPRTAGTSLAGQVVGGGIVLDMSRHMRGILELNTDQQWVKVQPGVIRDDLNRFLAPHGLYFGPETSTANRAMIGGMVGNNSCGSNSVVYGSTREHVRALRCVLSDGSAVRFEPVSLENARQKTQGDQHEAQLYRQALAWKADPSCLEDIQRHFPKPEIPRRNTGYALDLLLGDPDTLDFTQLLCGSEGTLAIASEITLKLVPLPPRFQALVCAHFHSIDQSLRANLAALEHEPSAVELMDHYVLDCTKDSLSQRANRFFVEGEPRAVLVIELSRHSQEELDYAIAQLIEELKKNNFGYAYPIVRGADIKKVWALRKAGLGLLSNIPGDAKPVPVIEDTAVAVSDLPEYIRQFNARMAEHNLYCVHYAHAGSGELHLRPILNLKTAEGQRLFRQVADDVAQLVKQFRGSLSGEHGDGRLRAEYLAFMVGQANYDRMLQLKRTWDPLNLFNPGKIVEAPPMDHSLRYTAGQSTRTYPTVFQFRREQGILRAVEQCNGSGDCRKPAEAGGTMCPSYQASLEERDSTRGRANVLREVLTHSTESNPFADPALAEVLDRCLGCKGCTGECPSNVDMARMRSEWLHQRYRDTGQPLRARFFAHAGRLNEWGARVAPLSNALLRGRLTSPWIKRLLGVHPERQLPRLHGTSLKTWMKQRQPRVTQPQRGEVWLLADPFSNRLDVPVGQAAVQLLEALGYAVQIAPVDDDGRTYISKGFLPQARRLAEHNVKRMAPLVSAGKPLLGLEPSSLLSFRDEYPDLVRDELLGASQHLAAHSLLLEDFLWAEHQAGRIGPADFDARERQIALHGHCHQKALVGAQGSARALAIPSGHQVTLLQTGCCGMAGSFGYEAEHYALSQQIGELALFPALRSWPQHGGIAAPGTSCRHQILEGTGRVALHPAEWLWEAVRKP